MGDLIDRQAAIDALMVRDKELRNINWYDKPYAEGECRGIDYALEIVNALPSVQPTQSNASNALKTLDCIDRQAAIDAIGTWDKFGVDERCRIVKWHEGLEPYVHLRDVVTAIANLPSAQPKRKTGEWVDQDRGAFYTVECSECHKEPLLDAYGDYVHSNFCPNCGAKMEGAKDG